MGRYKASVELPSVEKSSTRFRSCRPTACRNATPFRSSRPDHEILPSASLDDCSSNSSVRRNEESRRASAKRSACFEATATSERSGTPLRETVGGGAAVLRTGSTVRCAGTECADEQSTNTHVWYKLPKHLYTPCGPRANTHTLSSGIRAEGRLPLCSIR